MTFLSSASRDTKQEIPNWFEAIVTFQDLERRISAGPADGRRRGWDALQENVYELTLCDSTLQG
jgi:hypothetical protein